MTYDREAVTAKRLRPADSGVLGGGDSATYLWYDREFLDNFCTVFCKLRFAIEP